MKSFFATVILAVSMVLSACAQDASRRIDLSLWLDTNEKEMVFFKQIVHQFEAEYPQYRLKLRFIPFDDLKPRFQGQVGETRDPDILYMMNDWVGELAEANLLRPLSFEPEGAMPQALKSMTYQDKIYGAPFVFQTIALVYNRKLLDKPPGNRVELVALERKPHDKDLHTLLYDQRNFYYHAPWFHACGGRLFDAQGHFVLKAEPLRKSLRWAYSLQQLGIVHPGSSYSVMVNLFAAGQSQMMITGPWSLGLMEENDLDYAVAPLPRNDCQGLPQPFIGFKGFGVNRMSRYPEEAEKVIRYLTSAQTQEQALSQLDNLPVHQSVYRQALKSDRKIFYQQLQTGIPMPNFPMMKDVWRELNWLLGQVFDGQPLEPRLQEALERLQRRAREYGAD